MTPPRPVFVAVYPTPMGRGSLVPTVRAGEHHKRPGGLTDKIRDPLLTALRSGATLTSACEIAGVPPTTVRKWIQRGEGRDPQRPATPEYVEFARLIRENRAAARVYAEASLLSLSRRSAQAATNWLDANGDDEWKDARREIREGSDIAPGPVSVSQTVNVAVGIDAREQNLTVYEIRPENMPEFLRTLIGQTRDDHAKILAAQAAERPPQQDIPDGHRSPRLDRLRVSSAD